MNVLLIQPSVGPDFDGVDEKMACAEPLNLEYLGAGVRDLCDVKILDMRFDKNLEKALSEFKPDVVGVTGFATHSNSMNL